jgi:hypothetical protein
VEPKTKFEHRRVQMETIHEAVAIAEPHRDEGMEPERRASPVPSETSQSRDGDLALQIRMTASSLAGIALMQRDPDPEPSR